MNNKDYKNVLKCLRNNPNGVECLEKDLSFFNYIKPFFSKLVSTKKRPDAYGSINNDILLLEHFQFDNSQVISNGSKQKITSAETDRKIEKILNTQEFVVLNENVKKCGKHYVGNFKKQFLSHANKINDYKREIQIETNKKYNKIFMGFVIEDSSILGSFYFDKKVKIIDLVFVKEFLDLFEKTPNLDFVIFAMTGNDDNRVTSFISHNTIEEHRANQIEVSNIQEFLYQNFYCASGNI